MRKPFKEWEKDFIYLAYPLFQNKEIANILNRDDKVIQAVGCSKKYKKQIINQLLNQKFGKLLVLSEIKSKNQEKLWQCKCDCGKFSKCTTHTLRSGHSKSCGCERLISIRNGYKSISGTWFGNISRGAKKRGFEFTITKEYLNNLLIQQNNKCALSGLDIQISQVRSGKQYYEETTASLDRMDNTKGYIEGNVQFLHKHVNYMKWTHNQEYFLQLCKIISDNKCI